jgi:hypothetical protein
MKPKSFCSQLNEEKKKLSDISGKKKNTPNIAHNFFFKKMFKMTQNSPPPGKGQKKYFEFSFFPETKPRTKVGNPYWGSV